MVGAGVVGEGVVGEGVVGAGVVGAGVVEAGVGSGVEPPVEAGVVGAGVGAEGHALHVTGHLFLRYCTPQRDVFLDTQLHPLHFLIQGT